MDVSRDATLRTESRTRPSSLSSDWGPDAIELLKEYDQVSPRRQMTAEEAELEPIPSTRRKPWLHQLRGYHFAKNLDAVMLALEMRFGKRGSRSISFKMNMGSDLVVFSESRSGRPADSRSIAGSRFIAWHSTTRSARSPIERPQSGPGSRSRRSSRSRSSPSSTTRRSADPFAGLLLEIQCRRSSPTRSIESKRPAAKFQSIWRVSPNKGPRVGLTGTPLPHSRLDAFGQYRFLDRGIFGNSFTTFRARYAEMGGYNNYEIKAGRTRTNLRALALDHVPVKANEVQSSPVVEITWRFKLSRKAAAHYKNLATEFLTMLAPAPSRPAILRASSAFNR